VTEEASDATADSFEQPDQGTDSSSADTSAPVDSGQPGVESGLDSGTTTDADAGINQVLAFATAEATAICGLWQPCCPAIDAGTYSMTKCVASLQGYGWEANLPYNQDALARGNIAINQSKASACLAAINTTNIPCGTQTAAGYATVTAACEGVLQGLIPNGQPGCISSFECAPGAYCSATTGADGGVVQGTCTALSGQGGPCFTVINTPYNPIPDEMCSYLGSSSNGLYCDLLDAPDSGKFETCQPILSNGATCETFTAPVPGGFYYDDQACPPAEALCGDNGTCGGTSSFPYAGSGPCSFTQ
jgi:hypothetical protein